MHSPLKKRAYNWETKVSTVLSITLVLLLLSLLLTVEYHSYRATHDAQERITYKVDLVPEVTDEQAANLCDSISTLPYVKHVDYISKEEAAEIFSEEMGVQVRNAICCQWNFRSSVYAFL